MGFEIIIVGKVHAPRDRLRFSSWMHVNIEAQNLRRKNRTCQNLSIKLGIIGKLNETDVGCSLFSCLILIMSPGTRSTALMHTWLPSRMTMHSPGSVVVMEAITLEEDQSCQALKAACIMKTARRTHARATFAVAGGSPRGFQAVKTRTQPTNKIDPKPTKRYPIAVQNQREDDSVGWFFPCSAICRWTCSLESPCEAEVDSRWSSS